MDRGHDIRAYFNAKAPDYDRMSKTGLWARVREREGRSLARLLGPLNGVEVLDLGCGTGHYAEKMKHQGALVFGVDSSAGMIATLREKGIEGRCGDVSTLRLRRKFPVIFAAGLVEFLPCEKQFFRVAAAHAQPGARLVMLAPKAGLVGKAYELAHLWMGCAAVARRRRALESAAEAAGWKLERSRSAGPIAIALRFREAGSG